MKSFVLKLFSLIIIIGLGLIGKSAVGAEEKASSWLGVFTTDNVPIKGCYVTEYYGVFWRSYYLTSVQWANFNKKDNYITELSSAIDKTLDNVAQVVRNLYPGANALIGVDFKFITNFEPLVSKNYYIR